MLPLCDPVERVEFVNILRQVEAGGQARGEEQQSCKVILWTALRWKTNCVRWYASRQSCVSAVSPIELPCPAVLLNTNPPCLLNSLSFSVPSSCLSTERLTSMTRASWIELRERTHMEKVTLDQMRMVHGQGGNESRIRESRNQAIFINFVQACSREKMR